MKHKDLIDDDLIKDAKVQQMNNHVTKQQANIIIILLTLILIALILNCFFTFDARELAWLILNKLN